MNIATKFEYDPLELGDAALTAQIKTALGRAKNVKELKIIFEDGFTITVPGRSLNAFNLTLIPALSGEGTFVIIPNS